MKYIFVIALLCAHVVVAQQKSGLSSDELLQMALKETRENRDYEKAIALCRKGLELSPDYIDIRLLLGRLYTRSGKPGKAEKQFAYVLDKDPGHIPALKGLASVYAGQKEYAKAVVLYDKLLHQDPGNQAYLFKKSGLLEAEGDYKAAAELSKQLMDTYKDSVKYRQVYIYQRLLQAKKTEKEGRWPDAFKTYRKVYEVSPEDTVALKGLVSGYYREEQYDTVLKYAEAALDVYPGNAWFLRQKTGALEKLGHYREAIASAKQYDTLYPEEQRYGEYTGKLRRKASKNQLGVIHLQSFFDNGTRTSNITSLQYMRYFPEGTTLTGRLNYANRQSGDGFQAELESYFIHNKKYYSYILAGWSDSKVFPKWRLGYSLYRNFNKGWEGELGMRYLRSEGINTYSGTWSVGKYFGNNWLNLRGYMIKDADKWHQAYILTGRHYLNEKKDHLALILGAGTSPDDRNRNFQYNAFGSFISQSAGVGYQKTLGDLATISLYAVWNHRKIGDSRYLNQYDVYISLFRNF